MEESDINETLVNAPVFRLSIGGMRTDKVLRTITERVLNGFGYNYETIHIVADRLVAAERRNTFQFLLGTAIPHLEVTQDLVKGIHCAWFLPEIDQSFDAAWDGNVTVIFCVIGSDDSLSRIVRKATVLLKDSKFLTAALSGSVSHFQAAVNDSISKSSRSEANLSKLSDGSISVKAIVVNKLGLHARASAKIAIIAENFTTEEIRIVNASGRESDAKSIASVMSAAVASNQTITIKASGLRAEEAVVVLAAFIESGLGEGENGATSGLGEWKQSAMANVVVKRLANWEIEYGKGFIFNLDERLAQASWRNFERSKMSLAEKMLIKLFELLMTGILYYYFLEWIIG